MKQWHKFGLGLLVLGGILLWVRSNNSPPSGKSNEQIPVGQIIPTDWTLGNPKALVQIVEYSDFQCPACKFYSEAPKMVVDTFGNSVGFAYRFFPLKQIHKNSTLAAQAAEAAGKQGKFWEMGKLLFDNQSEWENSNQALMFFAGYAQTLGLNIDQFRHDVDSAEVKNVVETSYLSALVAKIDATPTFFINGQKINNLKGPDDLITRVRFTLEEATASATPSAQ